MNLVCLLWLFHIITPPCVVYSTTVNAEANSSTSQNSVSTSSSAGPTYKAEITLQSSNGDCTETVLLQGNGVTDTLTLPCKQDHRARAVVNEEGRIVVGGDTGDGYGIVGSAAGTLTLLREGKCVERAYPPGGAPQEKPMGEAECDAVKKDIHESLRKAKEKKEQDKKMFDNIEAGLKPGSLPALPSTSTGLNMDDPFEN